MKGPKWIARVLGLLLALTVALAGAADDTSWADSLADANRQGATERKPVVVFFLDGGAASQRFERSLARDRKLKDLLADFAAVKVDPADHADLVERYHMELFPAVLFLMPGGRPIKLMVGITQTAKVRGEAAEALEKFNGAMDPANWFKQRKRSPRPTPPRARLVHPSSCPTACEHCEPAIEGALDWLTARQSSSGNWSKLAEETETKTDKGQILTRSIDHIDSALTGLAGLALLTTGSTPGEGRHGGALNRARSYLRRAIRDDGEITAAGDDFVFHVHSVFETAFAVLFLAECQKLDSDADLAKRLTLVARALEEAQDERSGGWGYSFGSKRNPARDKTGWRLLATTHCALSALNALADAGIPVSDAVRERGVAYLASCIAQDGQFGYRAELRMMPGHPGATAGALYAMARSGAKLPDLATPRRTLRDNLRTLDGFGEHWWFMVFFAALQANDAGEGSWRAFHEYYRDVILAQQRPDGSFEEQDKKGGRVFSTAIAAFVLQLDAHRPPISGRRTGDVPIEVTEKPTYLKVPNPLSRVKVFERGGGYLADLIVSVDGEADEAYLAQLADGLRGASRILWDITDGQMALHRVTIHAGGERADDADVLVTKDFYSDPNVPRGGAHGITMVTVRNEVRNGREIEGVRIGEWVKLPYAFAGGDTPVPWHHVGLTRVIAHELGHYLLGIQDEYGPGGSYCACLVGDPVTTELCRDDDHSDDRRARSCWTQARRIYPKLRIPVGALDAGPWDPPVPLVEIAK